MTQQQMIEFERAIGRAQKAGIRIAGRGHLKGTGERILLVTSASDPVRLHIVVVRDLLACDCEAAKHNKYCQHRAVAHRQLVAEELAELSRAPRARSDENRVLENTVRPLKQEKPSDHGETAMLASRADNRGFSIWRV